MIFAHLFSLRKQFGTILIRLLQDRQVKIKYAADLIQASLIILFYYLLYVNVRTIVCDVSMTSVLKRKKMDLAFTLTNIYFNAEHLLGSILKRFAYEGTQRPTLVIKHVGPKRCSILGSRNGYPFSALGTQCQKIFPRHVHPAMIQIIRAG